MSDTQRKVKVWDICLRLFHWSLAILFALSSYSAFQDKFGIYADMHFYAGYTILILIVWRFIWGFVGSETARFSSFVGSPKAAIKHFGAMISGTPYSEVGHSPLAGYSVLLMLILLFAQATMGLFATDGMIFSGPLSREVTGALSSDLTKWHKLLGLGLLYLIGLHILVICLYGLVKKANLVWPMIIGSARIGAGQDAPELKSNWLGLLVFFVAGGLVCTLVFVI